LELLRWLMHLLGVELARLAPLDHFCCIPERRSPVETLRYAFAARVEAEA
jgi:hypothetical protein